MDKYSEKLKDKRWQIKRLKIFERDQYNCQNPKCKSSSNAFLHIHHLDYIPGVEPWDYPDDMLLTLCETCHTAELDREKLEIHLSNTLKMKGFLLSDLLALSCKIDTDQIFVETLLKVLRNG